MSVMCPADRRRARRYPSPTGWRLARTVACCAVLDAVLAGEPIVPLQPRPIRGMRLAVPTTVALDELEDDVARTFERALETPVSYTHLRAHETDSYLVCR